MPPAEYIWASLAEEMGLPLLEFKPDYGKYGRGAPLVRNTEIVNAADYVLAFPSGDSKGTYDAIRKARQTRKMLRVCALWHDLLTNKQNKNDGENHD